MKKPVVHHQADEQNQDSKDINYNAAFKAYIDLRVLSTYIRCVLDGLLKIDFLVKFTNVLLH